MITRLKIVTASFRRTENICLNELLIKIRKQFLLKWIVWQLCSKKQKTWRKYTHIFYKKHWQLSRKAFFQTLKGNKWEAKKSFLFLLRRTEDNVFRFCLHSLFKFSFLIGIKLSVLLIKKDVCSHVWPFWVSLKPKGKFSQTSGLR